MNWKKWTLQTFEYIFYGVVLLQVFFGSIWMIHQFPHVQSWQQTLEYLEISQSFVLDEYVGFLYPVFLRIFTEVENLIGIPYCVPVYVVQLGVALWAGWLFSRNVLKMDNKRAGWAVAYLVSFPMLLQFHMAIRPESLAFSGMLLLLCVMKRLELRKFIVIAGLLTATLTWLMPDMVFISVALWIVTLLKKVDIKVFAARFLTFVLALLLGLGVNMLTQTPGSRGRIQKTFWAAGFQRVVTEYFSKSFAMWDGRVKTTFTIEEAMEQVKRSDNMVYTVGPMLEADWGKKKANELYKEMTLDCLRVRTRDVVYQIRDDFVDTMFLPFSTWWQDNGARRSQTGWNLGRFREYNHSVSSMYMHFSVMALAVLLIMQCARTVILRKNLFKNTGMLALAAFVQAVLAVMTTGNAVDYGKVLLLLSLWGVWGLPKQVQKQVFGNL